MWFKMGLDILNCGFMRELKLPLFRGDNGQNCRIVACIYLLSITATGGASDLQDAADLARLVDTTPKQAQIVWDVCIKHGVLRKGPQGYSARPWMIERGILSGIWTSGGRHDYHVYAFPAWGHEALERNARGGPREREDGRIQAARR